MSLYPPTQAYGHMAYPAPSGYGQPSVPPAGYYAPPPAAAYHHVDPNTFRRDYSNRLTQLTINSRPIIQSLSMLAQEYSRFADIVVQCIDAHIRRVPPWMKLPAFYLLDAISKNVFDPYAHHFTPLVVTLFLDTYEQVDQSTRSKMDEMLLTWRTGAPNGRELFGIVPQVGIERHIWRDDSTQNYASSSRHQSSSSISNAQVLSELEFVLGQKERFAQTNPYDEISKKHLDVLRQLRALVQAGVSQAELSQILTQLRSLAQPIQHVPQQQQSPPPAPQYQQAYPLPAASTSYGAPAPQYPPQPAYSSPPASFAKAEPADYSNVPPAPAPTSASVAPAVGDISSLYSALLRAGVVGGSASATPTGAGATAKSDMDTPPQTTPADPAREAARQYRKAVLKYKIKLTTADITKHDPPMAHFLYDVLPVQCKQCAVRFPDTVKGKKTLEDHMDMHFRQNRKASQAVGRGHSRSWFVSVEDWIHNGKVDVKGKSRADCSGLSSSGAAAAADAAHREAELRAQFVVVPPGDEAKTISCPICKEQLKSEFNEDDEEWIWRNAVRKGDQIFHATCHAEAMSSKSYLVARLKNEATSRSRSRTPERPATPSKQSLSPPGSASRKRKADDDDSITSALSSTLDLPPQKKVAV